MLEQIETLPLKEQSTQKKEIRGCIEGLLYQASAETFKQVRFMQGMMIEQLAILLDISAIKLKDIETAELLPTKALIEDLIRLFELDKHYNTNGQIQLTYHEMFFANVQAISIAQMSLKNELFNGGESDCSKTH